VLACVPTEGAEAGRHPRPYAPVQTTKAASARERVAQLGHMPGVPGLYCGFSWHLYKGKAAFDPKALQCGWASTVAHRPALGCLPSWAACRLPLKL